MYIELDFLLLIYAFSTISLGVSVYALWTLKELEDYYKTKNKKPKINNWEIKAPTKVNRPKGHWD